jgi:hypothetical protein
MQYHQIVTELKQVLEVVPRRVSTFSEHEMIYKPHPLKWSKQEILGHLVDSALHNWQRFANVQFAPQPFVYEPYRQDDLVRVNRYQQLPTAEILALWEALNRQLVRVLEAVPEDKLNLAAVHAGSGQQYSLLELAEDYVVHLKHHLQQIFQTNPL